MTDSIIWFVPEIAGATALVVSGDRKIGFTGFLLAALGIVFALLAKPAGIMIDYDEWISMGMPSPSEFRIVIIGVFAFSALVGTTVIWRWIPDAQQDAGDRRPSL